jgi:hypothetical protein
MEESKKKEKKKKSVFSALKKFILPGPGIVPAIAKSKAHRIYVLATAFAILSIVFAIVFRGAGMAVFGLVFGVLLFAYGYYDIVKISKRGYFIFDAECIGIKYHVTPSFRITDGVKRRPREFVAKDPKTEKVYAIPAGTNGDLFIKEDSILRVYAVNGTEVYERQGLNYLSEIIGFELLSIAPDRSKNSRDEENN